MLVPVAVGLVANCYTQLLYFTSLYTVWLKIAPAFYVSAHCLYGARDIMFSHCPFVCACVRVRRRRCPIGLPSVSSFFDKLVKNQLILLIFGMQNCKEIWHKCLWDCPLHFKSVTTLPCEMEKKYFQQKYTFLTIDCRHRRPHFLVKYFISEAHFSFLPCHLPLLSHYWLLKSLKYHQLHCCR